MQSLFAVKNASSIPAIHINIDGERIFTDILKGDTSPYIFLPVGSITLTVFNNSEKCIFSTWLSIAPQNKLVFSVIDEFLQLA